MANKFEIEGYHGTFKENINNILEEGYTSNKRDDHWLNGLLPEGMGEIMESKFQ